MCQKTIPNGSDRAGNENNDDPSRNNVIQNSNLEMGFVNQALSMEVNNDSGYRGLQKPLDGYETIQKPGNPLGDIPDYPEYMATENQFDIYEEVSDTDRKQSNHDDTYDGQVGVTQYSN